MPVNRDNAVTETSEFVFFWRGWPSQWVRSPFALRDAKYNCCEQFMMAEKARVFGDEQALERILSATSPRVQKELGRTVRNFDPFVWDSVCQGVVYTGNLAKFSQNEDFKQQLLATGSKIIVEASPVDSIWGIGLAASDRRALDPSQWQGTNWLGIALMRTRRTLRDGDSVQLEPDLQRQLEARDAIRSRRGL